ncbi:class I SAM-dependent methyltransferase [Taibaiella koreensis]|uniref:class I SAM-dependent methyltransferase n=1 Tax=Taibaiella koreensis TaxID=1268548 RepID=UPI000E5A0CC2|nr:class I SAM-dependent methyltransferase [Taibaiella koreensis]
MEQQEKAAGWDFSYLERTRRMVERPLPWNYYNEILPYLRPGIRLLDMGTGGGEFLSLLPHKEQCQIYATEGYTPNVAVAAKRLSTFGATLVSEYEDDDLPFESNFFDLVINRHESYSIDEVARILRPGGHFINQQVDRESDRNIADLIGQKADDTFLHWNLAYAMKAYEQVPLMLLKQQEDSGYTRFFDTEALIFYIRSMPYLFTDYDLFDFEMIRNLLDDWFAQHAYADIVSKRFILCARKT